jgi:hypothetical protein
VEQSHGDTLSKFDRIILKDASAVTSGGHEVGVLGATSENLIKPNGQVIASGSVVANDKVEITYHGP